MKALSNRVARLKLRNRNRFLAIEKGKLYGTTRVEAPRNGRQNFGENRINRIWVCCLHSPLWRSLFLFRWKKYQSVAAFPWATVQYGDRADCRQIRWPEQRGQLAACFSLPVICSKLKESSIYEFMGHGHCPGGTFTARKHKMYFFEGDRRIFPAFGQAHTWYGRCSA